MIKVVFIDIDDTLLDFHKCMVTSARKAEKTAGITLPDGFDVTFHKINNALWKDIELGKITHEDLFAVRWKRIFAELKINFDGVTFEKLFLSNMAFAAEPVDGALSLLSYLAPKYRIYVASNAPHEQQINRLAHAGMSEFLQGVNTSEYIGYPKPSEEFFSKCLELANVKAENAFMIGDSMSADIEGAKRVGMQTCHFDRKKSATESDVDAADFRVCSLEEIKNIL